MEIKAMRLGIDDILANARNITIAVGIDDLREIIREFVEEIREERMNEERVMTAEEVTQFLGIGLTTLHHMQKDGRLIPAKIGTRSLYRRANVLALLEPDKALTLEAQQRNSRPGPVTGRKKYFTKHANP